jgi:hypothetical protein
VEVTAANGTTTEQWVITVKSRNQIHIRPKEDTGPFQGFVLKRA